MKLYEIAMKHGDRFFEVVEIELRKLAAEQPEFRYKTEDYTSGTCHYNGPCRSHNQLLGPDCRGCIFGQAFQRLGWDNATERSTIGPIADLFSDYMPIGSNFRDCPDSWPRVQSMQDKGFTWSKAISALGGKKAGIDDEIE